MKFDFFGKVELLRPAARRANCWTSSTRVLEFAASLQARCWPHVRRNGLRHDRSFSQPSRHEPLLQPSSSLDKGVCCRPVQRDTFAGTLRDALAGYVADRWTSCDGYARIRLRHLQASLLAHVRTKRHCAMTSASASHHGADLDPDASYSLGCHRQLSGTLQPGSAGSLASLQAFIPVLRLLAAGQQYHRRSADRPADPAAQFRLTVRRAPAAGNSDVCACLARGSPVSSTRSHDYGIAWAVFWRVVAACQLMEHKHRQLGQAITGACRGRLRGQPGGRVDPVRLDGDGLRFGCSLPSFRHDWQPETMRQPCQALPLPICSLARQTAAQCGRFEPC